MKDALLLAVLDTLLPGDDGVPPLPSASRAGLDIAPLEASAQPLLDRIDAAHFLAVSGAERAKALRSVEHAAPAEFRRLLDRVLAAYYQSPDVLAAFGWRSAPPMPLGHMPVGDDAAVLDLLGKVRSRGALWRR